MVEVCTRSICLCIYHADAHICMASQFIPYCELLKVIDDEKPYTIHQSYMVSTTVT